MTIEQVDVRASEIAVYRQCPLLRKIVWEELWAKPEDSFASTLGTAWHKVIGSHYARIQEHQEADGKLWLTKLMQQDVLDHVDAIIEHGVAEDLRETLDWMYDGHLEAYGFDDAWEIVDVETHKQVAWPNHLQPPGQLYVYNWTSDLVIRDHSMQKKPVFVVDNKSTENPLKQFDIDLSDQLGMYTWAERVAGLDVLAPMIRQVKTKKLKRAMTLDERYADVYSYRTDQELRNISDEAFDIAFRMYNDQRPYSSPDPRICHWKCDFKEVHLHMRKSKTPHTVPAAMMRARGYVQRESVPTGHEQLR